MTLTESQRARLQTAAWHGLSAAATYRPGPAGDPVLRAVLDLAAAWTLVLCEPPEAADP